VGKRWKQLTPEEQEPFRKQASLDKIRYEEVLYYILLIRCLMD
jgi:hypothetical protein